MESIQSRVETWIRDQRTKILKVSWGPLQWPMRWQWPPWNIGDRVHRRKLQQEYERHKIQLQELCLAVKADSLSDLQDILCCMVLSECVYKKPATEMIRAVNKYKADFGGQIVSLERVQPSLDDVPHRYLLAEAGDTLFASFIGTKQYKDVMADANILQGAIFHEDAMEDIDRIELNEANQGEIQKVNGENQFNSLESKPKQIKDRPKPAAHRGFMARAKGIPALELYRLAQKKKRKLVLCGHSLGGAVAALATLAILRVIAVSSSSKETEKVQVKCITFSQPPVGNAALRDYVNIKGWQHYFKSYCIPEDLVPHMGSGKLTEKNNGSGDKKRWRRVPSLPSYVPFGQLYLLGSSSVESLSGAEYSKLTSVRSVIVELRERFQSHSMKSYRSRFQRIYDLCMNDSASSFFGMEQMQQFPHLQQWLGLAVAGAVEIGHIVESPIIRTATSIVPLGWNGIPGEKNAEPLKVDITGFRLHLCTLVHAHVNGKWCSTTVESFPSAPAYSSGNGEPPELQKIRVLVGAPLRRPPKHQIVADSLMAVYPTIDSDTVNLNRDHNMASSHQEKYIRPDGLSDFFIVCTSDFTTASKEVHVRTRRVRLLGLEGAGKTSLFKAILGQGKLTTITNIENLQVEADFQDGIAGGLCYSDTPGVNLQELAMEASRFKDELWRGIRDLSRKTDLIVLVHNLSHKIPRYNHSDASQQYPALSLLLDEAKALGIPWVLAITNKFSVSAHQQRAAISTVVQAYQASLSTTEVINSCPYVMPGAVSASLPWGVISEDSNGRVGVQKLLSAPIDLVRRPFQRKDTVFPVEGVNSLCHLVHRVLQSHEEASLEELARERLSLELAQEHAMTVDGKKNSQAKASSLTSAAVGASFGAGVGIILAVVMGAASALRKP
ncbi:uncharacterized protein LOC111305465 isoform X5 [Durio zibethinus]|uniref:Uncharacterized protein LOC111305465 isoform X5 n=1 Tax=Durio zibethinus TaxID=66656 RepID=A0A6P6A185_DURZI|nr:uncharacterized protein LOC111305465 isoform X5 [Durio zibethinus]